MMPKNLFLVRHGQSEGNLVQRKFEETGDESFFSDEFLGLHESQYKLTELGEEQAKKAGKWFVENNFTQFYRMLVSNNVRAMQTAAHLNLPNPPDWMIDFNLRERDAGLFNVILPSKRDEYYSDQQKFYNTQPFLFRPPQGESIADVCQRIKIVLDTLSRECDGHDVIIVCHGHVIRSFRIILERLSLYASNNLLLGKSNSDRVPNCSVFHYTRQNPKDSIDIIDKFGWMRMIRPAGGGDNHSDFFPIERKKYTNEELFKEAEKNRTSLNSVI